MAIFYVLSGGRSLPERVFVLRLINLLLTSVAIPAAWMAARHIPNLNERDAVALAAIAALVPEIMFDGVRVSNSGLAIALYSALSVLCLRIIDRDRRSVLGAGAVLGFGLLTKAFFSPRSRCWRCLSSGLS